WERSSADFQAAIPRILVSLRVNPTVLPHLRGWSNYARIAREDAPDADGWVPIVMQFDVADEARAAVFRFAPDIEVVDPPELRASVAELAAHVRVLHARSVAP